MRIRAVRTLCAATATLLAGWALLQAQGGTFRFDGPLSRVITPNSDGRNDVGIICFDNFADSDVAGKIYSLRGAEVAVLQRAASPLAACPTGNNKQHMDWDPRSQGNARSGVYVYQLKAEGMAFSGTFLVVR